MNSRFDAVVIGAGIGGLCAAIELAVGGLDVVVLESASEPGGKAGVVRVDGVEVDTGPSVLTLPSVFEELFTRAGRKLRDYVELIQPEPAFRYVFADGVELDLHHDLARTLASIETTLGHAARDEFAEYLRYAKGIWEAAAPHFVFAAAPTLPRLLLTSLSQPQLLARIDPLRSLAQAIEGCVASPHLRKVLFRFATYNGSDVRRAPATLGCIAHVELALGGFGVSGGMSQLSRALFVLAQELGVEFRFEAAVSGICQAGGRTTGVRLATGEQVPCRQVVSNADVGALADGTIDLVRPRISSPGELSLSAHCGILRARRRVRAGHTVLFAEDYAREFEDLFDRGRVPSDPTIYLCAQEVSHGRLGWQEEEPVFVMVNAPAVSAARERSSPAEVQRAVLSKLRSSGLVGQEDDFVWWRTPEDLAKRFPGSQGALYGPASNDRNAAFRRMPNRPSRLSGFYVATGSAHPGGGVPLAAQSGIKAAELALADRGGRR